MEAFVRLALILLVLWVAANAVAFLYLMLITYWWVILIVGIFVGWIYWMVLEERKKEELRLAQEQSNALTRRAKEREEDERKAALNQARKKLQLSSEQAEHFSAQLKLQIADAELQVRKAETEFKERVFAPFWDAVEQAANSLAQADESIWKIIESAKSYQEAAKLADPSQFPFPVGLAIVPDTASTARRLNEVVREGQRDFQFATIFEQRKTNRLLHGGFKSLGEALGQLGDQVERSVDALKDVVTAHAESSKSEIKKISSSIDGAIESMEARIRLIEARRKK